MTETDVAAIPSSHEFLFNLANKVRGGAGVTVGDPIELADSTIIPVAAVWYGFGGGASDVAAEDTGSGGGGGSVSIPLGAYLSKRGPNGEVEPPVFEPNPVVLTALGTAVPIVGTLAWAAVSIARTRSKKRHGCCRA